MAESAGELTFEFGADFSGFSRAADSAGQKLDQLSQAAKTWASGTSAAVSQGLGRATSGPLALSGSLAVASQALRTPSSSAAATTTTDDQATKELAHLADQLALLKTTGAAHDAIVESMKIETEQAKLGTDATTDQKQAVAALVGQIDAAKTAQASLKTQQGATNDAFSYGAGVASRSIDSLILNGGRIQNVAATALSGFARQGLDGALTGSGSFAGLFGTTGQNGQTGGLFGALQSLFTGGLSSSLGGVANSFSGLYANGGTIGAGQWGIAGEKGAEIVAGPATVVPWNKIATMPAGGASAGPQIINFNVTTPDAPSFARTEGQMTSLLSRAVGRGQRNS